MNKHRKYPLIQLFLQFMQFGFFTFGGGNSIVAQIHKKYVEEDHSLTSADLLDLMSVGRSLPGIMVGNVSVLFGHQMAGTAGSLVCLFGLVLPPFVVLAIITSFYAAFNSNLWVIAAMKGIRCSIAPIIAAALTGLVKGSYLVPPCVLVTIGAFCMYHFLGVSSALIVVFGAVCGLMIAGIYERFLTPIEVIEQRRRKGQQKETGSRKSTSGEASADRSGEGGEQ